MSLPQRKYKGGLLDTQAAHRFGISYTSHFEMPSGHTLANISLAQGDSIPGVTGGYIQSVSVSQDKMAKILVVSGIQPKTYGAETNYSSGTMELRGSRITGEGHPQTGTRYFLTDSLGEANLPSYESGGDYPGDTGNFKRKLVDVSSDPNFIKGLFLVTCSYSAPRPDPDASGEWAAYAIGGAGRKGDGTFEFVDRELLMPNSLAKATFGNNFKTAGHEYDGLDLLHYSWRLNQVGNTTARVKLTYSSLTTQEWMMRNINQGIVFSPPAATSQQRLVDLDGTPMRGQSWRYPLTYNVIMEGENVSILPKKNLIIRAIIDQSYKDKIDEHDAFYGYVNDIDFSNTSGPAETLLYMGTDAQPLQGDRPLWMMEAHFLKGNVSWNQQCRMNLWKNTVVSVPVDNYSTPGVEWRQGEGWFFKQDTSGIIFGTPGEKIIDHMWLTETGDSLTPNRKWLGVRFISRYRARVDMPMPDYTSQGEEVGEWYARLVETHDFSEPFDNMIVLG